MEIIYYNIDNNKIKRVNKDISVENWQNELDWVDIYYSNIDEALKQIDFLPFIKLNHSFIKHPENNPIPKTKKDFIIQNFTISKKNNIYRHEYFSIIIAKTLIIRLIPKGNEILIDRAEPEHNNSLFKDVRFFYIYKLMTELITLNINNLNIAKKRLHTLEDKLINKPDTLSSGEVMSNHTDVGQLADIIEDQYVSFRVFTTIFEDTDREEDIKWLRNRENGFKELNRMIERLEEKTESFRFQFMVIQQEASTRKINILTIIQAIFVPLTFIAGVYGMNFKYMPELEWQYSYFGVWAIFAIISTVLIYFFRREKWFN